MPKAPSFWYQKHPGLWCYNLWPLTWVYRFFARLRRWVRRPQKAPFPVISVGNLVMGGAGKTPVVKALSEMLKNIGYHPVVISKGYGAKQRIPLWVDASLHTYKDVGDEALLLSHYVPTLVCRRRKKTLDVVPFQHNVVLILDDGHQQRDIKTDINVLVYDHKQGVGNGCVFPQGPLREPVKQGMSRAHAVVHVGGKRAAHGGVPVFYADFLPSHPLPAKTKVWGVCGLGYPQKFFHTLKKMEVTVAGFSAFPDHHPYTFSDLHSIAQQAAQKDATLVTTEKDWMRWPENATLPSVIHIDVHWHHEAKVRTFLKERLQKVLSTLH
ncbi:tetraacyldisaccharide 4'-kinase [bacterium NHP-B]|nr:tetraacyldisaccharide 4'-kinase [bacterium NHP-B]